MADMAQITTVC